MLKPEFLSSTLWSILTVVPRWGWASAVFVSGVLWLIFSPVQKVRRAAGIGFGDFPRVLKALVRRFGARPFIAFAKAGGRDASRVFQNDLPPLRDVITRYGMEPIAAIARTGALSCLPPLQDLIAQYGIEPFVAIAEASGRNALAVFQTGLPFVRDQIQSLEDLERYGRALVDIAQATGENAGHVFACSLPLSKDLIAQYGIEPFVAIAQAAGKNAGALFASGLPAVRDQIQSLEDLERYGRALVDTARAAGENADAVFAFGLPAVRCQIQSLNDLKRYGQAFAAIAQASGPHACLLFRHGLAAVQDVIWSYGFSRPDLLIERLRAVRASLTEPWDEDLGEGGTGWCDSYGQPYMRSMIEHHDPDGSQREGMDALLAILQRGIPEAGL